MTNFHKIFSATTLALTLISLLSTINLNFNLALAIPDDDVEYLLPSETIHDVLSKYFLPKGLLPAAVKSFSWSGDGDFEVELEHTCYFQFDELLYYEKKITGHFYYGSVSKVTGIRAKFFFDWFPVTGIDVDRMSGRVEFFFGFLSTEFLHGEFNSFPMCLSRPNELESKKGVFGKYAWYPRSSTHLKEKRHKDGSRDKETAATTTSDDDDERRGKLHEKDAFKAADSEEGKGEGWDSNRVGSFFYCPIFSQP